MGRGVDGCREDFVSYEESNVVGIELVEEIWEEVYGLKCFDIGWRGIIFVVEGGDDEYDEVY